MSIERNTLTETERTIVVDYYGNQLTVVYRPSGNTADKERARQGLPEAEKCPALLAEMMVSWDVVDNGEPLPPTKQVLMSMPTALLIALVRAIAADMEKATEILHEKARFLQLMSGVFPSDDDRLQ